ncbi:kinase-like domain-containing protein [Boletus edulis BED1]|uniref:Kinase-like domain-containing protein n=1 Tax=Boletus edulis BED1 TaxID=1328754 RepID=A0AAD4GG57_BOLED|nr:kinase-like domain-containing protein [Boletus edulis BED1]
MFDAPRSYFEHSEDSSAEDGSQEEVRSAGLLEVMHTAYHVASYEWQRYWQPDGPYRRPLKEHVMDLVFFGVLLMAKNRTAVALRDKNWPITVVVKRDNDNDLRQYCPRSDFLISNSTFPRLLVEVNSTSQDSWPKDLIRMLTTGDFVVRFANKFVSTFRQKNFVLCAVFIWDNGTATRYTLFQNQNDDMVYYKKLRLSLDDADGRAEFARYLYNLLSVELDDDQDSTERGAIRELHTRINDRHLKSFYTKNPTSHGNRKRPRTDNNDDDAAGGGGGDGRAQLRACGYEVKPEVIMDSSGGEWAPLSKMPDHILTVYRPTNPNKEFIAKKVRKESNEPEIFRLLDTILLKSDHVISLVDSFNGWAILPKMSTVDVGFRAIPESKVLQVCLGLIKGVAYLHEHHIAHRDIKPDNLVVDNNFNLKIIDLDVAMQVEDEDEEVDDQCGTRGWTAPEVEKRHSPIEADRWACGRVLLSLLGRFGKEDESLRVFAKDLMALNPKQRPSLLEWGRYSAPLFSDAGNIRDYDARKALRPRRDRMEVDGEITKPPNVKKQRLELGQCNTDGFRGLGIEIGAH